MRAWVPLTVALALFAFLLPSRPAAGQGREEKPAAPAIKQDVHFGAGSCASQACHGGSDATRAEYTTWVTKDRHSRAFTVLSSAQGQRIGKRLGIDPTQSDQCLNCHGTVGVEMAETFDMADGVSCEQCHGGAERWLGPHAAPGFKTKSSTEKARLGLTDLSTPAARAALCVTCHVAGPGRDITHAIMAAGHPPLVFEASHFLQSMPPHWKDERDQRAEHWLEGLKASAAASLGHVARMAARTSGIADFSVFDCYACHHPIYSGSVYEKRKPAGKPGDLALELSSLRVLIAAAGLDGIEFANAVAAPGAPSADLERQAKQALETVRTLTLTPNDVSGRMERTLAAIESGERTTTRTELQLWAMGAQALANNKKSDAYATALRSLDEALAADRGFRADACAQLVRALMAAGK